MLNGSLDTVALPDVLRLIASSGKSGLIRIIDASPSGRIFIVDGRIAFATNRNDDDPIDDLLHMEYRADYVGSPEDRRIVDLNDLLENNPEAFNRFLEQMIVEVLSRLLRITEGEFRFDADIRSRREIPHSFEVEEMIAQAAARADAWERIFQVVPSAAAPFRMAPRLDRNDEIVLARRDWALLAATGVSTTVQEIAQRLKIFEFAAAKKVAELAERGLIEFTSTELPETSMAASELLSGVADTTDIRFPETIDSNVDPVEEEFPAAPEPPAESETQEPPDEPAPPQADRDREPTWLSVEEKAGELDDPVPLLEELHRLHQADAAAQAAGDESPDDGTGPGPVAEDPLAPNDDDTDDDSLDDGDLATRWKNLRRAKRGVHASNE